MASDSVAQFGGQVDERSFEFNRLVTVVVVAWSGTKAAQVFLLHLSPNSDGDDAAACAADSVAFFDGPFGVIGVAIGQQHEHLLGAS
jgi:hypothetical protein